MRLSILKKVNLTMNENLKYLTIKKLIETNGNKKRAALKIGCSERHVNRLVAGYKKSGKEFFVHGNHAHKPATTIDDGTKKDIILLYQSKYYEANFTHFQELLAKKEGINVSVSTINAILRQEHILSPKAHRTTKKKLKKELKALKATAKTKKEQVALQASILELDEAHPRHPRAPYFGELIQMDASSFVWFGDKKTHLHVAVDDYSGAIVGAWFDTEETLNGYYNVLHQILRKYGIPYKFFTDKRTVFEYKRKNENNVEKDTFTQFGYACKQLGIDIQTSSVAQSKGRVERMNNTLQSRLPIELRVNGITTMEAANKFLKSYLKEFNKHFALPFDNTKSVFEKQPTLAKINLTLAVLSTRIIDNGCSLKYHNDYYIPVNACGKHVFHRKGTSVVVIKAFNNELYACIGETVYGLEKLPAHKTISKDFDLNKTPKPLKRKYIPPMSHPWKKASFERYLATQKHIESYA